jgi:hypothetical protein
MKLAFPLTALLFLGSLGCSSSENAGSGGSGGATSASSASATAVSSSASSATSSGTSSSSGSGGAGGAPPSKTLYIAGGQDLRRAISTDGQAWTNDVYVAPSGKDNAFTCITSGKGLIVAGGDDGVWTSKDGVAWTRSTDTIGQEHLHACVALHDGKQFVILSGSRTLRSSDGLLWEKSDDPATGAGHWGAIAFGAGHYVAVGDGARKVSEDATTWHDFVMEPAKLHGVVYANGQFVAVGDGGRHITSKDGKVWDNDVSDGALGDLQSLAFGKGTFVAMNCCEAVTSTDGLSWKKQTGGVNGRVVFGGGRFVGAGWRTNLAWSEDGNQFTNAGFMGDGPNQFDPNQQAPWFTTIGVVEVYP